MVDEYGDLQGIVTLEDILEEIVGDIDDEHDVDPAGLTAQADGSWIVDGAVTIRDLNRALGWQLPDEDASTIAGLVLYESRTIPRPGQEFRFHDIRFRILKRDGNKLTSLRLWSTKMSRHGSPYGADHATELSPPAPREEVHNRRISATGSCARTASTTSRPKSPTTRPTVSVGLSRRRDAGPVRASHEGAGYDRPVDDRHRGRSHHGFWGPMPSARRQ